MPGRPVCFIAGLINVFTRERHQPYCRRSYISGTVDDPAGDMQPHQLAHKTIHRAAPAACQQLGSEVAGKIGQRLCADNAIVIDSHPPDGDSLGVARI